VIGRDDTGTISTNRMLAFDVAFSISGAWDKRQVSSFEPAPPYPNINALERDVAAGDRIDAGTAYPCAVAGDQERTLAHFSAQRM